MSAPQTAESPGQRRTRHQHYKSASQTVPNENNARQPPRKQKGNGPRRNRNAQETSTESAVLSSEEGAVPNEPRVPKKHTQSQPLPAGFTGVRATDSGSDAPPSKTAATPVKAYAGPTFHASPAASALPKPSFLSKSVPAKAQAAPGFPVQDASDSLTSHSPSPPSPTRAPIPIPRAQEDSPLDLLFRADRAERTRNGGGGPSATGISNLSNRCTLPVQRHHQRQDSQGSAATIFPIELEAENRQGPLSPPQMPPATRRSVTAPSGIQQTEQNGPPDENTTALQDLLNRLAQSQRATQMTPPVAASHMPSEPSSRHQTPSPFHDGGSPYRSASGPTTPAPATQDASSDFFYGNRNLSPLFKAAKGDSAKRGSGLRTEIRVDSPQGAFPPVYGGRAQPMAQLQPTGFQDVPTGPRRGSVPQIPPYRGMPNNQRARTPGNRQPNGLSTFSPRNDKNGVREAEVKSTATDMNPFIPSSVRAKRFSQAPKVESSSAPEQSSEMPPVQETPRESEPPKARDTASLEQDLKRLLNLKLGDSSASGPA